jgi:hypothetical protein
MGAAAVHLCEDLSNCFSGKRFEFMELGEFQTLDPSQMGRIYWREILFRIYWAAALNLMRHQRWQAGCVRSFTAPANLLAFASSLRGLLEASQDAYYSLSPVPYLLAEHRTVINTALKGEQDEFSIARELEDRLIHFIYGRKVGKGEREMTPSSHIALDPKDYRNAVGLPDDKRDGFRELYDDLCGISHPTAFSMTFLWEEEHGAIQINGGQDDAFIRGLCHKYEETISFALSLSVTMSALCLKALNWFSLLEVRTPEVERWNFGDIPAWRKAQAAASRDVVR